MKKSALVFFFLCASISTGLSSTETNVEDNDISKTRMTAMCLAKSSCHVIECTSMAISYLFFLLGSASLSAFIAILLSNIIGQRYGATDKDVYKYLLKATFKSFAWGCISLISVLINIYIRTKALPKIDPKTYLAIKKIKLQKLQKEIEEQQKVAKQIS